MVVSHQYNMNAFGYTLRSCADQSQRQVHRLYRFDISLDPEVGVLVVTAMERKFEQAANDETKWAELRTTSPLQSPCVLVRGCMISTRQA